MYLILWKYVSPRPNFQPDSVFDTDRPAKCSKIQADEVKHIDLL